MNFKKSYKSANGYTKICKIGESSLKKLEFGIIELKAGEAIDFYTAGGEVLPEEIAKLTTGFSGAALETFVNECKFFLP